MTDTLSFQPWPTGIMTQLLLATVVRVQPLLCLYQRIVLLHLEHCLLQRAGARPRHIESAKTVVEHIMISSSVIRDH